MSGRFHTVAELPQFLRDAEAIRLSDEERRMIVDTIAANPLRGDQVRGSGGVRKVRFAGRGKGKSGGYRVMVAYIGEDAPTYLLAILSKGDRENFSASEVAAMEAATSQLKEFGRNEIDDC